MVGTYWYPPNVDAAVHMATRVMPHLRVLSPACTLRLVGRGGAEFLGSLRGLPGVEVVGDVADVAPELLAAAVAVAPVRFGGGTRVKILEAFALGVPLVSTPLGCEGLDAEHGVHLLVADEPQEFAAACARLIANPEEARRLGQNGRRLYESSYTPSQAMKAVTDIAVRMLADNPEAPHAAR
jgi:glycosyltransferase involved in cell wall biosynthesis